MNVYKKTPEKFGHAIYNLSMIIFMVITMFVVCYMSPTNIISRHARIFIYFVGFSFGKLVVCIFDIFMELGITLHFREICKLLMSLMMNSSNSEDLSFFPLLSCSSILSTVLSLGNLLED